MLLFRSFAHLTIITTIFAAWIVEIDASGSWMPACWRGVDTGVKILNEWKPAPGIQQQLHNPTAAQAAHCGGDKDADNWWVSPWGDAAIRSYAGGLGGLCWQSLGELKPTNQPGKPYYETCVEP